MTTPSLRKLWALYKAAVVWAVITGPLFAQSPSSSADAPAISDCVNALEQLGALEIALPAYKQLDGDRRQYLDDGGRPAEIARLQKVIAGSCSNDRKTREIEQAAADRLHTGRSPECIFERDKLLTMQKPGSRDPPDDVAAQRALVAKQCPEVPTENVWLLQPVWNLTS